MKDSQARIRVPIDSTSHQSKNENQRPNERVIPMGSSAIPVKDNLKPPLPSHKTKIDRRRQSENTPPFTAYIRSVPSGTRRWGKRRPWRQVVALTALLTLSLAVPAVLSWPRHSTQNVTNPVTSVPNTSTKGSIAHPDPSATGSPKAASQPEKSAVSAGAEPHVRVYVTSLHQTETLPMEDYIIGVVAAEMPAEFGEEALKAQAIAARTFITRRLLANDISGTPDGSDVTDTVKHQAYISRSKLDKQWGNASDKSSSLAKIRAAVRATKDTIMVYKGKPITASFFSTSNGYTENSEDVWKTQVPYLRSVSSPWDKQLAPGYKQTVTLTRQEMLNKLGLSRDAIPVLASGTSNADIKVLSTTEGHRIKQIEIAGNLFTGTEIRAKLGLRSSEFTWRANQDRITITTYGYGHGVGMSQWGANGMAKEGYSATQILQHYYTGISFAHASRILS